MKIRRILSFFVATTILVTALMGAMTVLAETPEWWYLGDGGIKATLDDNGVFTVTGKGDMPDTSTATRPYKKEKDNITSVVISNGITSIGDNTFSSCSNLVKADIADTVTSIGVSAFAGCTKAELVIDIKGTLNNVGTNAFGSVVGKIYVYNTNTYNAVYNKLASLQKTNNILENIGAKMQARYNKYGNVFELNYTSDSFAAFKKVRDEFNESYGKIGSGTLTNENALEVIDNIDKAYGNLKYKNPPTFDDLKTAIEKADPHLKEVDKYTEDTLRALDIAITSGKRMLDYDYDDKRALETDKVVETDLEDVEGGFTFDVPKVKQSDVKDAVKAIEDSINSLVEKTTKEIEYKELEKIIAKAEVYLSDEFKGNYTEESISVLFGEVKKANVLINATTTTTTQQEVKDAVNAIEKSINNLVKKLNNPQLLQSTTKASQIIKEKIIKNRKGIKVKSKKRKITIKLNRKKKCKYLIKIFNNKNKNIAKNPVTQGSTSKKLVTTYKKIKKGKYLVQIYEVKANKAMNKISNVQCIYADYKKVK